MRLPAAASDSEGTLVYDKHRKPVYGKKKSIRARCSVRFRRAMSILSLLYWVLLVLSCVGVFAPASWPNGTRISGGAWIVLFIIIGLRIFRIPLQ